MSGKKESPEKRIARIALKTYEAFRGSDANRTEILRFLLDDLKEENISREDGEKVIEHLQEKHFIVDVVFTFSKRKVPKK